MFPDMPNEIMDMKNNVLKMRALVQYSIADSRRAKLLLKLLQKHNKFLYKDLCDHGPKGKTGKMVSVEPHSFVCAIAHIVNM